MTAPAWTTRCPPTVMFSGPLDVTSRAVGLVTETKRRIGPLVTARTFQLRVVDPPGGTGSRNCVRRGDQSSGSTYTLLSVLRMFRWAT